METKIGRPTKLTPELIELAWSYIMPSYLVNGKIKEPIVDTNGLLQYEGENAPVVKVGYEMHGDVVPTIEGLAQYIGISRDSVYAWEKDNKDFSDITEGLRQLQAKLLINGALRNDFNATISKLLLSSKHGYIEKSATDITTGGDKLETYNPEMAAEFSQFMKSKTKE